MTEFFYEDILIAGQSYIIERMSVQEASSMPVTHFHDFYEIYYLESGSRTYFIKNNVYKMLPGSIVIIPPYVLHRTIGSTGSSYGRILLQFHNDIFLHPSLEDEIKNFFGCVLPEGKQQMKIYQLLLMMMEEYHSELPYKEQYIKNLINELIITILRNKSTSDTIVNNKISDVMDFIDNNYQSKITLDLLSEKFNISTYYLSRTFKKFTAFNVISYINYVRLTNAQRQLKTTSKSITNICYDVGFENMTHFGRVFKALFGLTPSQYRNQP